MSYYPEELSDADCPTEKELAEIAERTQAVRKSWSHAEEQRRIAVPRVDWELPVYVTEYVPGTPLENSRLKCVKVYRRIG